MNLSLIITQANLKEMLETIEALDESQKVVANGGLCIAYDSTIPKSAFLKPVESLSKKFKTGFFIPVPVNHLLSQAMQEATIFGSFFMTGYTRLPGGWLIIDSKAFPLVENFMEATEKQHLSLKGMITGKGNRGPGSLTPVGPLVINAPAANLKCLRYATSGSWRSRGQYVFPRCRFAEVPAESYLWAVSKIEKHVPIEPTPIPEPVVESTKEGDAPNETWSREEIRQFIKEKTGSAPHHMAGMKSLLEMSKNL
jgi:hypothetical protein